jgi:broad specificity phosphatase PhoE
MDKVLGGIYEGKEYAQAMAEAKEEFQAWERNKRKVFHSTKEKYRAQRLAKLQMQEMGLI